MHTYDYSRVSRDFFTHGMDGIAVNRVAERHAMEQYRNELATTRSTNSARSSFRHALGQLLIAAGRLLAGAPATATVHPDTPRVTATQGSM